MWVHFDGALAIRASSSNSQLKHIYTWFTDTNPILRSSLVISHWTKSPTHTHSAKQKEINIPHFSPNFTVNHIHGSIKALGTTHSLHCCCIFTILYSKSTNPSWAWAGWAVIKHLYEQQKSLHAWLNRVPWVLLQWQKRQKTSTTTTTTINITDLPLSLFVIWRLYKKQNASPHQPREY